MFFINDYVFFRCRFSRLLNVHGRIENNVHNLVNACIFERSQQFPYLTNCCVFG